MSARAPKQLIEPDASIASFSPLIYYFRVERLRSVRVNSGVRLLSYTYTQLGRMHQ
jgi:hypothetical protein